MGFVQPSQSTAWLGDINGNTVDLQPFTRRVECEAAYGTALCKGNVCKLNSGSLELMAAGNNTVGVILDICDANGNQFRDNCRPASTAGGAYIFAWQEGIYLYCYEDGVNGSIDVATNPTGYANLIQAVEGLTGFQTEVTEPTVSVKVDSDTFSATDTTAESFHVAVVDTPANSAFAGTPKRLFRCTPIAAHIETIV